VGARKLEQLIVLRGKNVKRVFLKRQNTATALLTHEVVVNIEIT